MTTLATDHDRFSSGGLDESAQAYSVTAMMWCHQQVTCWRSGGDKAAE